MSRSSAMFNTPVKRSSRLAAKKTLTESSANVEAVATPIAKQALSYSPQSKKISYGDPKDNNLADFNVYPTNIRKPTDNDDKIYYVLSDSHGCWIRYLWELAKLGVISLSRTNDLAEAQKNYQDLFTTYKEMRALFKRIRHIQERIEEDNESENDDKESDLSFSTSSTLSSEHDWPREYVFATIELESVYKKFSTQIKNITVINNKLHIIDVGDKKADRMGCDACMIDIDSHLIVEGMQFDLELGSNHGFDFYVNAICRKFKLTQREGGCLFETILVSNQDNGTFTRSLHNTGELIQAEICSAEELHEKVKKHLLPRFGILAFIRNKGKNESKTFGTHAPNTAEDLELVKEIFMYFKVPCDFDKPKSIVEGVDQVNANFREWLLSHTFEEIQQEIHKKFNNKINPLYRAMCNRDISEVKTKEGEFHFFGHCMRIFGMSPELQLHYLGIDNVACKGDIDEDTGLFEKAELFAVEVKEDESPVKEEKTKDGMLESDEPEVEKSKVKKKLSDQFKAAASKIKTTLFSSSDKAANNETQTLLGEDEEIHPNVNARRRYKHRGHTSGEQ